MTIKTIRIKNKHDLSPQEEREVKIMIIFLSLFAAGMIIGAGIIRNSTSSDILNEFAKIFDVFTQNRHDQKIYKIFLNSLSLNIIFLILTFCSGLSCVGLPIISIMPMFRGIGYGMLAGYLLSEYRMIGMGYYMLTVFPGAIIAVTGLLISCSVSYVSSADILAVVLAKKQPEAKKMVIYIKHFIKCFLVAICASAADSVLIKAFAYLFTF